MRQKTTLVDEWVEAIDAKTGQKCWKSTVTGNASGFLDRVSGSWPLIMQLHAMSTYHGSVSDWGIRILFG